jgi:5,10-methylenetetrahydromethanopterin reductase
MVRGGITTFARFSVMHGDVSGPVSDDARAVLEALHSTYDMRKHTRADSRQAQELTPEFMDRFAIVGPPEHCIERLRSLEGLGIDKVIVSGIGVGGGRPEANVSSQLMQNEVLPVFS